VPLSTLFASCVIFYNTGCTNQIGATLLIDAIHSLVAVEHSTRIPMRFGGGIAEAGGNPQRWTSALLELSPCGAERAGEAEMRYGAKTGQ